MTASSPPKKYLPDEMEQQVLARWRQDDTFRQQQAAGRAVFEDSGKDPAHRFIFLEGPPTANGMPHPGHVLTRTLKDAVNRFHAMHGKWVPRNAGWDCHGLPVEIEVQKELGIEHVDQIEEYGVAPFLEKCKESVFRYKGEWEKMSERVGFWVDFDEPYITMDDRHIEAVWWSLKRFHDAGLLVKAHKVVPYSPVTGTTYSSHEVAQGYKDVVDTSVFVKFHLKDDPDDARILSWTTTPWTLPGNVALAVGADIDYVKVRVTEASGNTGAQVGEVLVLAEALFKNTLRDHAEVIAKVKGSDLVGMAYEPLFPGAVDTEGAKVAFEIVAADFVTTEDGTGVVHTAVMYGEDDYQLGMAIGLPAQHTVGLDGKFNAEVPAVGGLFVKDAATEEAIFEHLRGRDMFYRSEEYEHSYPHCWRTDTPLLYYAMDSWYIRMSQLREQLLANNDAINWVPETIKEGRMGDWLRNVKDWAFSRSRYWGTPLPVWVCDTCDHQWCAGGKDDLASMGIEVPELHRPHVDTGFPCQQPGCEGGTMQREPYVIDVWYDSGAAQFAQFPQFEGDADEMLAERWPIDFIAEGLDQTRGWFYSLLAIATALKASGAEPFAGPPYKNVVVNGLILAEDGQKMSKSKKNYTSPDAVFEAHGADATRWYLLSATAPWQDKRFFDGAVRDTYGKFFSTLWNTFLFHRQYAELDGWTPSIATLDTLQDLAAGNELDAWLLSRLEAAVAEADEAGNRFHLHKATRAIEAFVLDDLSNWWVRRSRDRFWAEADSPDKQAAHAVLWWALHTSCRLVAPFAPFMVEHIWDHVRLPEDPDSVHLARYPEAGSRDEALEARMQAVRDLAEAGRALRSKIGIPTRHPLARALLTGDQAAGLGDLANILQEELNVKALDIAGDATEAKSFVAQPNRAALGPTFKQLAPQVAAAIEALDGDHAHEVLTTGGTIGVSIEGHDHGLKEEHVLFEEKDRDGWATTEAAGAVLALYTERDEALLAEAFTREVIRRLQEVRKELDLPLEEQVDVTLDVDDASRGRLEAFSGMVKEDVRVRDLSFGSVSGVTREWDVEGASVSAGVVPVETEVVEVA
ncbi:MAG: isoleucine--tRNA ligase [Thermoplasmatota archaeon]